MPSRFFRGDSYAKQSLAQWSPLLFGANAPPPPEPPPPARARGGSARTVHGARQVAYANPAVGKWNEHITGLGY